MRAILLLLFVLVVVVVSSAKVLDKPKTNAKKEKRIKIISTKFSHCQHRTIDRRRRGSQTTSKKQIHKIRSAQIKRFQNRHRSNRLAFTGRCCVSAIFAVVSVWRESPFPPPLQRPLHFSGVVIQMFVSSLGVNSFRLYFTEFKVPSSKWLSL